MFLDKIPVGDVVNGIVNVVVEIPMNGGSVKYEFDKESGAIVVDRFMNTAFSYPCNYGFIPHTKGGDGDPLDVLVVSNHALVPGSVIKTKIIGMIAMEDEGGMDEKLLAVPIAKLDPSFEHVNSVSDLQSLTIKKIIHFFEHYKDLEPGKWVKVMGVEGRDAAITLVQSCVL